MQLTSFTVCNFRSISGSHAIDVSDFTVLVGKNNEGKSNILRALDTAMSLLRDHSRNRTGLRRNYGAHDYKWKRDFPIQAQNRRGPKQTTFRLDFSLNAEEILEFKEEIGVNLNGTLPLEIVIGVNEEPDFRVVKTGRGTKTLTQKSARIAKFVASRITFNYIPAIRTDRETTELIREMLAAELRTLEDDPAYTNALRAISEIQQPVLNAIAARVEAPLKEFLPSIRSVSIEISEDERRFSLRRSINVVVDDGTPTSIEFKGDGVKSLAALGLLKNSRKNATTGASILAIEEPESHLHPGAIHQINEILRSLASESQVVITTHNPLFVDRNRIAANVIVSEGGAKPAKSVKAVRDILGIKASDNLTNASYALVVEGTEDAIALKAILGARSQKLQSALRDSLLIIDPLGGAGNLSYKLSLLHNSLCSTHILLDNDRAGRESFDKASADNLCSLATTTFTTCEGFQESEFEDVISLETYTAAVLEEFGVDLNSPRFRGNQKWSSRLKSTFVDQGKPCTEAVLTKAKYVVAKCIEKNPNNALHEHKSGSIIALVAALERLVKI